MVVSTRELGIPVPPAILNPEMARAVTSPAQEQGKLEQEVVFDTPKKEPRQKKLRGLSLERKTRARPLTITLEDVWNVPDLNDRFKSVAYQAAWSGALDTWCEELVRTGVVETKAKTRIGILRAKQKALRVLNAEVLNNDPGYLYINKGIQDERSVGLRISTDTRRITGQLGSDPVGTQIRVDGAVLHVATTAFERRDTVLAELADYQERLADQLEKSSGRNLTFFRKHEDDTSSWQELNAPFMMPGGVHFNDVTETGEVEDPFIYDVEKKLDDLLKLKARLSIEDPGLRLNDSQFLSQAAPIARDLVHKLSILVPSPIVQRVFGDGSAKFQPLMVDTAMIMAQSFLHTRTKGQEFVREELQSIVMKKGSGGKIDALYVDTIGGRKPRPEEIEWAKRTGFRMSGEVVHQASQSFGRVEWGLRERKNRFSPDMLRMAHALNIAESNIHEQNGNGKHKNGNNGNGNNGVEQLVGYLPRSRAALWYAAGGIGPKWDEPVHGVLQTLRADAPPDEQTFILDRDQQREGFAAWTQTLQDPVNRRRAMTESDARYILHFLRNCINRQERKQPKRKREALDPNLDAALMRIGKGGSGEGDGNDEIEQSLEQEKVYLNPELGLGVFKGTSRKGQPIYEINYADLIKAIERYEVACKQDHTADAFFIGCINPKHQWSEHHTMHVNVAMGLVKCFSLECGETMFLDQKTLPKEHRERVRSYREVERGTKSTREVLVTNEHMSFMRHAQEAFQAAFWNAYGEGKGSGASWYLENERGLDPKLAYENGAGFGDQNIVTKYLLEKGWSIDKMIKYGIWGVRFDDVWIRTGGPEDGLKIPKEAGVFKPKEGQRTVLQVLIDSGLVEKKSTPERTIEHAKRRIELGAIEFRKGTVRPDGVVDWTTQRVTSPDQVITEPGILRAKEKYFKWNGRITCPLKWQGMVTNFYGRATWKFKSEELKAKGAHRKGAKVKREEVEVNGVKRWTNPPQGGWNAEILQQKPTEIWIVEGWMDGLTIKTLGKDNVIAVIGTDNEITIEEIAALNIPIYMALDAEIPGGIGTLKVFKRFRDAGHTAPIYNVTKRVYPEFWNRSKRKHPGAAPMITLDDLREYQQADSARKKEIINIRRKSKYAKDHNDAWKEDRELAQELIGGYQPSTEDVMNMEDYHYVFGTKVRPGGNGLVYQST